MPLLSVVLLLSACDTTIEESDDTGGEGENDTEDTDDTDDTDDTESPRPASPSDDSFVVIPGVVFSAAANEGLLVNDLDVTAFVDADTTTAQGASVTVASDGSFTYTTPTSMAGTDSFTYRVQGDAGGSVSATVQLTPRPGCGDGTPEPDELCYDSVNIPTAGTSGALAAGDLDGDGDLDVVVSGVYGFTDTRLLVVLTQDGALELAGSHDIPEIGYSAAVELADLDDDDDLDLVVLTRSGIQALQNDGTGTFTLWTKTDWQRFDDNWTVNSTDLDGDGNADLVVSSEYEQGIASYFGDGTGAFALRGPDTYAAAPKRLYLADVVGTSAVDILILRSYSDAAQLDVLESDGAGGLTATTLPLPNAPGQVLAIADLNNSDGPDIIVPTGEFSTTDTLTVLPGNGAGGFAAPADITPVGGVGNPFIVEVADLDGDGNLDIITFNYANVLQVSWGAGTHQPAANTWRSDSFAVSVDDITAVDVTGDGTPELLVLTEQGVQVLTASSNRTLFDIDGSSPNFSGGSVLTSVRVADVNGDGHPDIIVADFNANDVKWLQGDGAGGFSPMAALTSGLLSPQGVELADLDGDGDLDILTANTLQSTVSVRLNDGTGTFSAAADVAVGPAPARVAVADINGDGVLDFVTANVGERGQVYDGAQDTVSLRLGVGDGTFTAPDVPEILACDDPERLELALINGDAHLDVLVTCLGEPSLAVLLGDGTGAFSRDSQSSTDIARQSNLADLNGDGHLDFVQTGSTDGTLRVFLGDGSGQFSTGQVLLPGGIRYGLDLADLDDDGHVDIISPSSAGVSVFLGNGDGTFPTEPSAQLRAFGTEVSTEDVNGDGALDIIVASSNTVTPLLANP